jgi:hypothetical protein
MEYLKELPRINELSPDNRTWRIDWFGGIERNEGAPSDPLMEVIISPLRDEGGDPASQTNINIREQKIVRIGVGLLPVIIIGSLWKSGMCICQFIGNRENLKNVVINDKMVRIVESGQLIDGNALIPVNYHSIGMGVGKKSSFKSKCICIGNEGDAYKIIIPVMELIRFYYATSNRLSQALFTGSFQLDIDSICKPDFRGIDPITKDVHLSLRREIPDSDGWVIARILLSPQAAYGARRIYNSMLLESNYLGNQSFPETNFPFLGETTLSAMVKTFPIDEKRKKWRYLVFSLSNCTGPFPFGGNIHISRDNDNRKPNRDADKPDEEKKPINYGIRKIEINDENNAINVGSEPSTILESKCHIDPISRFPSLLGRSIMKDDKEECYYRNVSWIRMPPIKTNDFGVGKGVGGTSIVAPLSVRSELETKQYAMNVVETGEVVDALNKIKGINAIQRILSDKGKYVPLIKPKNSHQWSYKDSDKKIKRRTIVVDVESEGRFFTLVDFEWRDHEEGYALAILSTSNFQRLSDYLFNQIIWDMAVQKGVWKAIVPRPGLKIETRKHTWNCPEDAAKKIQARIFNI